jgi:crotonobetainyl-CoA:carnitine CoA-transferase CaiB-like acyl-CoA transferase
MAGALEDVRVLDLSVGIAGPLGVLLLAEQGADVIKVEPPGGDPYRAQPGSTVWHRSRRSVELDLTAADGLAHFKDLVNGADVLVEAFSPGTMDRLSLGYEQLAAENPRLVYCSIPAYPRGHRAQNRAGYDALVQARSGQQWEQPGWRPGPIHLHFPAPSMGACFLAASGVLAALIDRESSGRGQRVDTSLYQGVLAYTTQIWQEFEHSDPSFRMVMHKSYPPGIHQPSIYECANGEWIHASTMAGGAPTSSLDAVVGVEPADPLLLYTDPTARAAHAANLRTAIATWDRTELLAALHGHRLGAEAIVPMEKAFEHPQLIANEMVASVDDPALGATTQVGVPIRLARTPGRIVGARPRVGEHTEEVLSQPRAAGSAQPPSRVPDPSGPLAGIVVLDVGQYLAGPFAPMILGDLGAEVIKIEPVSGDKMRPVAMPFIGCQRGKLSVAVDLKDPDGAEVVLRLAERADVVHHNMTKGAAGRLGLDYGAIAARNPQIIHCNTYAYGAEGPLSDSGGLDPLYQAACGLEYEAGPVAHGNEPLYLRFGMTDTANAFLSVVGVLAALFNRYRSGEGQDLWTSLLNGAAMFSSDVFLTERGTAPRRPGLDAGQYGLSPCYRLYETQDGWIQVAAVTSANWRSMCAVLEIPELADDPRAASFEARASHRAELEPDLEARFATRTAITWQALLDGAGVPAEVSVDTRDGELALHDSDNDRLGLVTESEHPLIGRIRQFGSLINFSANPNPEFGPPPMIGQHTRETLTRHGFDAAEIAELMERGVLYEPDDDYPLPV